MGFSFVALLPFMLREPFLSKHKDTLQKQWKGLVAIGLYMVNFAPTRARHWSGLGRTGSPTLLCLAVYPPSTSSAHCLQALNIALNNLSLVLITLSLNQVIRWGLVVMDQHCLATSAPVPARQAPQKVPPACRVLPASTTHSS